MNYPEFTTIELNTEIWEPIDICPFYAASTLGRIKRIQKGAGARHDHIKTVTLNKNGYLYVSLCHYGKQTTHLVHRLIALTFLPPPTDSQTDVNHRDNNRLNNRITNLEFCTRKENLDWADSQNRLPRHGEDNPLAKLTNADIPIIRGLMADGWTDTAIGQQFNVHRRTVNHIRNNRSWRHVS